MRRLNLKIEILKNNINQKKFAKKIGLEARQLSGIITGRLNPQTEEEKAIRKGLGLNDSNDGLFEMIK